MWHVTSCPAVCARIIPIFIVLLPASLRTHHAWSGHVFLKTPAKLHKPCIVSHREVQCSSFRCIDKPILCVVVNTCHIISISNFDFISYFWTEIFHKVYILAGTYHSLVPDSFSINEPLFTGSYNDG